MPQSLAQVWLHIVFSTKDRQLYLKNDTFRDEMFRMISHHVKQAGCVPLRTGGWHDHVHIACGLSRTTTIASLLEQVKVEISKWAKAAESGTPKFSWQAGYAAFSISQSILDKVVRYIDEQEIHHRQRTFQDEFRELCLKHEISIDEKYIWD